jgi:hypothetical protein
MRRGAAVAGAVGLLIVGFAAGSRLGDRSVPATVVVTPAPIQTQSATAPPAAEPTPALPIQPAVVDPALKEAYYRFGGGFAMCATDPQPSCASHDSLVPLPDREHAVAFTDQVWAQLHPFQVPGNGFVAVEALDAASVTATLLEVTSTSTTSDSIGFDLPVANPSGQGIYYIDVGHQSAGRYLVIVRALAAPYSKVPANPAASYVWQTNVLALDVA